MALQSVVGNRYLAPGSRSAQLYEEARRWLPGGNSRSTVFSLPYPPYASHARGCVLVDVDGQERLDFINNYTSLILGHADPGVTQAVIEQLWRGSAFGLPTEHEILLAREIARRVDSIDRVRFVNSGTEAAMVAIQLARAYTGRPKIAKFEGCYHGAYDYAEVSFSPPADAMGDVEAPRSIPTLPGTPPSVAGDVVVMPFNRPEIVERLIEQHQDELAAVIVDPMPNRAGLIAPRPGFLERLRAVTQRHGILLIFDEVMVFRLSYGGAQGVLGGSPDLTVLAKVIGGGFPVGAVGGREDVMALFDPSQGAPRVHHGGTFNANPITMVAGYATLQRLTHEEFARLERLGDTLRQGLAERFARVGVAGQVTGRGSLFRVHVFGHELIDYRTARWDARTAAKMQLFHTTMLANGILFSHLGIGCLSTPMGEHEISEFVRAAEIALRAVRERFGSD